MVLGMSKNPQSFRSRFRELNGRAEGYSYMRLSVEVRSMKDFREKKAILFEFAVNFLKLYYVISAPVVTVVARSDLLMALARMLHTPTRWMVRRFLR